MKIKHIGVIIDGNRRYAQLMGKKLVEGHIAGCDKLRLFVKWCYDFKIEEVTFFVLSIDNLKREKEEVNNLFRLFSEYFSELISKKDIYDKEIGIKFFGNRDLLPKNIIDSINDLERRTRNFNKFKINFAIAYDGQDEIVRAVNNAIKSYEKDLTKDNIEEFLDNKCPLDLIIRTSEERLSGFMMWQSRYAELIFLKDIFWPQIQKKDLKWCLDEFERRQRRFGE